MRIHGILSYFQESPSWLAACVASMARVCDTVIAVDGRYALFDDDQAASPPDQAEAIVETATGAGLELVLFRPSHPFYGNEIEKRNLTLKLAASVGEPGEDWLLILDADCYITEHSDMLRYDLERTDKPAANVAVEEHMDPHDPDTPMVIADTVSLPESWRSKVTLLYRLLPEMAYEGTHYSVSGRWNGEKVWLWGHPAAVDPFDASHAVVVRHRNILRSKRRREQAAAYYSQRDMLGIEERPIR